MSGYQIARKVDLANNCLASARLLILQSVERPELAEVDRQLIGIQRVLMQIGQQARGLDAPQSSPDGDDTAEYIEGDGDGD